MKLKTTLIASVALVAGTAFVTTQVVRAQNDKQGGMPDMNDPMMKKMMELATPGEEHKKLGEMVGSWDQKLKMRMGPSAPWMEASSTSECTPLLGGRYVMEHIKFNIPGMPMEGIQIFGYDKMNGEYTSIWMDSMSTWTISSRGKAAADGTVELKGTMVDVAGTRPFRMVLKHGPEGHVHGEMIDTIDGKEVPMMIIDSTKKK